MMTAVAETTGVEAINAKIAEMAEKFARNHEENQHLVIEEGKSSWRRRPDKEPMAPLPLRVGQQVKFLGDNRWWTVRASNMTCAVLTRPENFGKPGLRYTVIVWAETRRGPQVSWGLGAVTDEQCHEMAEAFTAGRTELSERRAVYLDLAKVREAEQA